VRLDLGYDGAGFSGWAKQPGRRTVEGVLDEALATVFGLQGPPGLTVAGRTDAGVHARGQVAHSDLPESAWADHHDRALRRLRGVLPPDMRLTSMREAPTGFDARFAAMSRTYSYRLSDDAAGVDPLRRHQVVWHRRSLDAAVMDQAASLLLGEHDFVAFCKRREGASTVRTLQTFTWQRRDDDLLEATVVADAFCHNMVRSLVGACVAVGEGRQPVAWVSQVLAQRERSSAVTVMPPHGLTLEQVQYPADDELAARVSATRRVRSPRC
jgi:tRNA pseudouridine38-40 synthase